MILRAHSGTSYRARRGHGSRRSIVLRPVELAYNFTACRSALQLCDHFPTARGPPGTRLTLSIHYNGLRLGHRARIARYERAANSPGADRVLTVVGTNRRAVMQAHCSRRHVQMIPSMRPLRTQSWRGHLSRRSRWRCSPRRRPPGSPTSSRNCCRGIPSARMMRRRVRTPSYPETRSRALVRGRCRPRGRFRPASGYRHPER
jgi:hypothetical protein